MLYSVWDIVCRDKDGNIRWEEKNLHNIFHDEGEEFILDVVFNETQSVPATYYIGLDDRGTVAEADTLPPAGEPVGNGYVRQAVNSDATDWTVSQVGGDFQAVSKTVVFTAAGGPIPAAGNVMNMFLSTTLDDTGNLVASVVLSTPRIIVNGDSLNTDIKIIVSE